MRVKALYAKVADDVNMPVSTVGKVCRAMLCELAGLQLKDALELLKRYRIRGKNEGKQRKCLLP